MNFDIVFVLLALIGMIAALVWDKMRPGMVLLTVVVFFLCVGILTPKEMLEGFSNKGMITMLFLVSEGVRQSGALLPIDQETASRGEDHRLQGAGEDAPARGFRVGVPE